MNEENNEKEKIILGLMFLIPLIIFLFSVVGPWSIKLVMEPLGIVLSHSERFSMIVGLSILTLFFKIDDK